ncbi:Hypothetical predicted protein, partial [Mytilus galloprovincialis]
YGNTPLHAAAEGGFINIVKLLLERADIDPKKENKPNKTLLHSAARGGNLDIVELLLERADIDPNGENKDGDPVLHIAARGGELEMVKLLLKTSKIDPNQRNKVLNLMSYLQGGAANVKLIQVSKDELMQRLKINPLRYRVGATTKDDIRERIWRYDSIYSNATVYYARTAGPACLAAWEDEALRLLPSPHLHNTQTKSNIPQGSKGSLYIIDTKSILLPLNR